MLPGATTSLNGMARVTNIHVYLNPTSSANLCRTLSCQPCFNQSICLPHWWAEINANVRGEIYDLQDCTEAVFQCLKIKNRLIWQQQWYELSDKLPVVPGWLVLSATARASEALKTKSNRGSGGGSVGRAVASDSRDSRFESQHQKSLIYQL